jgi:DNA-binding transcriptional LysR family regulator
MDIRQMRYFERVARLSSFRQAARELYIAQPVLSRQIAGLEHELGARLFDRSQRRVVLTSTGHRLLGHVDRVLAEVGKLDSDMAFFVGRKRTHIRVGVLASVAQCVLPALLPEFVKMHPDLDMVVDSGTLLDLVEDVAEGRLDAAVSNIPTFNSRVREEKLFEDESVAAIPPGHEWAGRRNITLRELVSAPLIFTTRAGWFEDLWAPASKQMGLRLEPKFELADYGAIMELVRHNLGVGLLPLSAVDESIPVARVIEPVVQRTLGWIEPAVPHGQSGLSDLKQAIAAHLENLRKRRLLDFSANSREGFI